MVAAERPTKLSERFSPQLLYRWVENNAGSGHAELCQRDILTRMTQEELEHFYEAALTAGAILSGFIGTFLTFRIQREANYYRQPVTKFDESARREGRGQDAWIGLSRFNSSFLLIILGAACSMMYGVIFPLFALANWERRISSATILAGIVASLVLVVAYFINELFHYEILKPSRLAADIAGWKYEWILVIGGILCAALGFSVTYCMVKGV